MSFGTFGTSTSGTVQTFRGEVSGGPTAAGLGIQFERSENLRDWIPSGSRFADESGRASFEFIQSAGQKFFLRARLP